MAPQEARQGRLEAVPAQMFRTSDTRLQRRPSLANGRCGGRSRFNAVKILSLFLMTFLVGLFPTPQTRTRARAPPHTHTRKAHLSAPKTAVSLHTWPQQTRFFVLLCCWAYLPSTPELSPSPNACRNHPVKPRIPCTPPTLFDGAACCIVAGGLDDNGISFWGTSL